MLTDGGFCREFDRFVGAVASDVPVAATVYCDESGNSGPNYIDIPQPFYVLAGWLIPHSHVVEVNIAIDEFRKKHFRQRDELKASGYAERIV